MDNIGFGKIGKLFLEWYEPWWAAGEGGIQLAWPEASAIPSYDSPHMKRSLSHSNIGRNSKQNHNHGSDNHRRSYMDDLEDEIQCLEANGYESETERVRIHKNIDDRLRHWYRGISNFSEVENQPNMLMCWVAGESAKIADQLDDEEVRIAHLHMVLFHKSTCQVQRFFVVIILPFYFIFR